MEIMWARLASEDYDFLGLETDAKVAERIKQLIASIQETQFTGMGKPEPLSQAEAILLLIHGPFRHVESSKIVHDA
jgi:Txe/YoeB family toxin of Txe-Axe toxin-antitoxin module